jgi:hypothetical protein
LKGGRRESFESLKIYRKMEKSFTFFERAIF